MTTDEYETWIAEWNWAYRAWLEAVCNRILRQLIRETIADWLNPRQTMWEAFTACQSITPK